MIVIHTEKNEKIGSGHYSRCSAIAEELMLMGEDIRIAKMNESVNANIALIDGYGLSKDYFCSIHRKMKTAYIDDLCAFPYDVDLLINYALDADFNRYEKIYGLELPQLLIGPKYAPLRSQFKNEVKNNRTEIRDVLVMTGGSDFYNISVNIVKFILKHKKYNDIIFHVIAGEFNTHLDELTRISENIENINVYGHVSEISELMRICDLAISASGSTLYELCTCGVPTVSYILADNQEGNYNAFVKEGLIFGAGDCRDNFDTFCERVFSKVDMLVANKKLRMDVSRKMQRVADGLGAKRIAKALIALKGE